jgi:hypothetical protein
MSPDERYTLPIETYVENGKQLLGIGDYEVRSWLG